MSNFQKFLNGFDKNIIKKNESINLHLQLNNEAVAKLYVEVEKNEDLIKIVQEARTFEIPVFIIGAGSGINNNPQHLDGLVIKNNCRHFDILGMKGKISNRQLGVEQAIVYAEAGTIINQLVRFTIEEGLSGLEYCLGLPGTLGGAVFTNARYNPKSIYLNDCIKKIKIINKVGEIQEVDSDYFNSKPTSEFSKSDDVILSVVFSLIPADKKILWERGDEAVSYRSKHTI